MLMILAQDAAALNGVPAEFIKYFIICSLVLGGGGVGGYLLARRGSKSDPVHVHQPVKVEATMKQITEHAHQDDLDELRSLFHQERAANLAEHNAHRAAQAQMMQQLLEKGNERERKITASIHESKDELMRALLEHAQNLHERINPVAETVKGHGHAIEGLKAQLSNLWEIIKPHLGLGIKKRG